MTRGAALLPARLARERSRQRLAIPGVITGEQDEVGAALPCPDAALVLPDRLAVAREAVPDRLRPNRQTVPGHRQGGNRRPAATAGHRAACRDHQPVRIRDEGIDQLHLYADDRMEPGLLGGRGEKRTTP